MKTTHYDGEGKKTRVTYSQTVNTRKEHMLKELRQIAWDLLHPTDWYILRKADQLTLVPKPVIEYRHLVRSRCNTVEDQINNAVSHAQLDLINIYQLQEL